MVYKQVNLYGIEETIHETIEKKPKPKKMSRAEAIKQLKEIIEDRRSFDDGTEETKIFRQDIKALEIAIQALEFLEGESKK